MSQKAHDVKGHARHPKVKVMYDTDSSVSCSTDTFDLLCLSGIHYLIQMLEVLQNKALLH